MGLDISKLIEVGEKIAYDDQIGFAETITMPVQYLFDTTGGKYQLQLVLTCDTEKIINWHED